MLTLLKIINHLFVVRVLFMPHNNVLPVAIEVRLVICRVTVQLLFLFSYVSFSVADIFPPLFFFLCLSWVCLRQSSYLRGFANLFFLNPSLLWKWVGGSRPHLEFFFLIPNLL